MPRSRQSTTVPRARRNAVPYSQNIFASTEELVKSGQTAHILSEPLPKKIKSVQLYLTLL